MDAIKQQLLRIQQFLAGLSASQKMLTFSLLAIMVLTLMYWAKYASTAEMEPLLDQALSAEEISPIKSAIAAKGISYSVNGDRILVPADRKFEILADLSYAQLLPSDMKGGFDQIMKDISVINPASTNDRIFNHGKETTLAGWIMRWPGVKLAMVSIDGTDKPRPGRAIQPTAAVGITLKPNATPDKHMVEAAADLLVGSQAGLSRGNVKVMINGVSYPVRDTSEMPLPGQGEILEARASAEKHFVDKINNSLQWIPNVYATVSVDLNIKTSSETIKTVDPKNTVQTYNKSTSTDEENSTGAPSGVAGTRANMPMDANSPPEVASTMQKSNKSDAESKVEVGTTQKLVSTPAGEALAIAAAVRIPESHLINIWKHRNPKETKEPTTADLDPVRKETEASVRDVVRQATNIKEDTAISVATYVDIVEPLPAGLEGSKDMLASMPLGLGFGAKEIAIGVLAVVSLFMVSMMVRKSVPPAPTIRQADGTVLTGAAAIAAAEQGPGSITASADLAGEVGEIDGMLTGRELTAEDIETQQVIQQVGTLVKENPETAANLVRRWMTRG